MTHGPHGILDVFVDYLEFPFPIGDAFGIVFFKGIPQSPDQFRKGITDPRSKGTGPLMPQADKIRLTCKDVEIGSNGQKIFDQFRRGGCEFGTDDRWHLFEYPRPEVIPYGSSAVGIIINSDPDG